MGEILNWSEFLSPYKQAVSELKLKLEYIKDEYTRLGLYCPIETVLGRVKEPLSILGKAKKKNIPTDKIEEYIEDIAGIRIICQFSEDIQKVISLIKRRDGHDLTILEERDYITDSKASGYRSYHIIVKYPVSTAMGFREINAEIQIRTMAMNLWAVTEHTLNYKYKGNMPENIKERLKNCAEAAFNLDNEMSTIRNEIMYAERVNTRMKNLTANITEHIQNMYFNLKLSEVDQLNTQFVKLWNEGDIDKLQEFSDRLDKIAAGYRN